MPLRLQRIMLVPSQCDLDIVCKSGNRMYIVNRHSRAPTEKNQPDNTVIDEELRIDANSMRLNLSLSQNRLNETKDATLKGYMNDWPSFRNKIENFAQPFWSFRKKFYVIDDLVFKIYCLVVYYI